MNEELANLLIRITSVGFDEVLRSLREIEDAANRVSSGGGFAKLQDTIDEISSSLDEFKEGMKSATSGFTAFGDGARQSGTQLSAHTQALQKNQQILGTLAKAYASFWVMFNAPRKFFATLDGVAQFNRQLSTMSVMANMSRESLIALGAAAGKYGGSSSGVADLAARAEQAMQSFRMGQGGGAFEQAAQMYGLSLSGTGAGGLMQGKESLDNIVAAMEKLPTLADKKGLKNLIGIDDATFQLMFEGMEAWKQHQKDEAENAKRLAEAAAKTEEWNKATAELKKEWEILKTQIFVDLAPHVVKIVDWVKELTRDSGKLHGVLSTLYTSVVAIGTSIAAWKFGSAIMSVLKLVAAFKTLKAVSSIGGAVGGVGGAVGGAGGAVGGKGGFLSFLGLGVDIGNAIANSVGAGASLGTAKNTGSLYGLLKEWFVLWHSVTVSRYGYQNQGMAGQFRIAFKKLNKDGFLDREQADEMANQMVRMDELRKKWEQKELNFMARAGRKDKNASGGGGGKEIRVTMHIGTVLSSAENYGEFVKEMLGNAKDVVAQRMETADWFDSNSGVIVA